MPNQIKQDLNRSGWETTDFPSVCERCLPDNPFVQMLKEDYGAECKICTRPFTVFRFKTGRTAQQKRTNMCLTCARLKNCCQSCMLDLSFGLPIVVRDAALKMIAPGPRSEVNREYYAQEHEKEIEEGRGPIEAYEKTNEKAMELLQRLANSEPYNRSNRNLEHIDDRDSAVAGSSARGGTEDNSYNCTSRGSNKRDTRFPNNMQQLRRSIVEESVKPPEDKNISSLFITGIEDDLPEHEIRQYFSKFGALRSVVCSHRSHCAFINYQTRKSAEEAAEKCQGKAIISGCPLRVRWGRPKVLDTLEKEQRIANAREGRSILVKKKRKISYNAPGDHKSESKPPYYNVMSEH